MTDITNIFLQQVGNSKKVEGGWNDKGKSNIIKPTHKRLPFVSAAIEISKNIHGLQNFLSDHRQAYLDNSSKYISSMNSLSEDQKDDIDRESMSTIENCKGGISTLQHNLVEFKKRSTVEGDVMLHLIGVLDILQQNLRDAAGTFKKYKNERIKQKMQEAEGYFKLDAIKKNPISPLSRYKNAPTVETTKSRDIGHNRNRSNSGSSSGNTSPTLEFSGRNRSNSNNSSNNNSNTRTRSNSNNNLLANSEGSSSISSSPPSSSLSSLSSSSSSSLSSSAFSSFAKSTPTSPAPPLSPLSLPSQIFNRNNSWLGNLQAEKNNSDNNNNSNTNEYKKGTKNNSTKGEFKSSAELKNPRPSHQSEDEGEKEEEENDDGLLESEKSVFDAENAALQLEFDTMIDQKRAIDTQLEAVSQLFDELMTHAVSQREEMDVVTKLAEDAISHAARGTSHLQSATKRTVDFRLMVLLFLIICSVSLLFLHWYEQ